MTRTRVLWLTKGLGRGGVERLLTSCAGHLDRDRFAVDVAYVLPWKNAFVSDLNDQGVGVHCLGGGATFDPRWAGRLHGLIRAGGYHLVHTHAPIPAAAARAALPRAVALVHTEHNLWPRYRRGTRWANALTYGRNDAVIAVSEAVADSIAPRHAGLVRVVHHGVDARLFRPRPGAGEAARAALGLPADAYVVGTVANFTPKKDQRTLIDAFAALHRRLGSARLVLIGSGPLEAELRAHAGRVGIADAVHFAGSRDDVQAVLPGFDVFCLSSLQEGLPISLVEAMASGVPVVATSVGGIPEVVAEGVEGHLVRPGRPGELAEVLERLAVDEGHRRQLGRHAVARAAGLDIARTERAIEDVYDIALGSRR